MISQDTGKYQEVKAGINDSFGYLDYIKCNSVVKEVERNGASLNAVVNLSMSIRISVKELEKVKTASQEKKVSLKKEGGSWKIEGTRLIEAFIGRN